MSTIDGLQPNSYDAEQAVIGAVLFGGTNTMERAIGWIKDRRDFYGNEHMMIWDSMYSLYKSHSVIDAVTVCDEVKKRMNVQDSGREMGYFLTGLYEACPTAENVEEYAKIVWERFIKREAIKSAQALARTAEDNSKTISDILYKHQRFSEELRRLEPTVKRDISSIVSETIDHLDRKDNVIPFGINFLDKPAGGMTRQELTVLGGRPGHGKSTLMINIVSKIIEGGYKVMLFNREMSNTEMMKKLICVESKNLSYDSVRRNQLNGEQKIEIDKVSEIINTKYKNLMMYDNIRTLAESMRESSKHRPDVIIDDYIQLIDMEGTADQRRLEIEKIMYEYKWLCKSIDCSAILLSQLNRDIERRDDPVPQMSDFAESGAIEQTAEMAAFVYYPFNTNPSVEDRYETKIIIAKSRYGNIGRYTVGYDGNSCKFYETVEEARSGKTDW